MSETLDNPKHAAAVDAALAELPAADLAEKANFLTGSALRADDALKVARLVCMAALWTPGKVIRVAGFAAAFSDGHLTLAVTGDITDIRIPDGEEEGF